MSAASGSIRFWKQNKKTKYYVRNEDYRIFIIFTCISYYYNGNMLVDGLLCIPHNILRELLDRV